MNTGQTNFCHVCCLIIIFIHSGAWCKKRKHLKCSVHCLLVIILRVFNMAFVKGSVHCYTLNFWTIFSVCAPHFRVEVEPRREVRIPFCLAPLLPGSVMMFVLIKATLGVPPCEGLRGHNLWAASLIQPISGVSWDGNIGFSSGVKTRCFVFRKGDCQGNVGRMEACF